MARRMRGPGLGKAYLFGILIFLGSILVGCILGILLESPLILFLGIIGGAIAANIYFWGRIGKKIDNGNHNT